MVRNRKQEITGAALSPWVGLERISLWFDERPWLVLLGCLLLLSMVTIPRSASQPLWFDEILTVHLSDLPSFSLTLDALSHGVDLQPPLLYIATRATREAFGNSELATRAPELVGFALLVTCVFWFVCRRTSALWGAVAALMTMVSGAVGYAHEARPYAYYLGFSALALLCWQLAADARWRKLALFGLWLSLALTISSHYYAVLVFLPLLLGEGARSLRSRRIDWPVLICIAVAGLLLLPHLPLIRGGMSLITDHAFPATISFLWTVFAFIYTDAAVPLGLTFVALFLAMKAGRESKPAAPGLSLAESLACLGFLVLPVPGYLMGRVGGAQLLERYLLPVVIGAAILFACGLWRAAGHRAVAAALFVFVLGGWFVGRNAVDIITSGLSRPGQFGVPHVTESDDFPLVIANPITFLQYLYYGTPVVTSHAVYVAEPTLALQRVGADTVDKNLVRARDYFPLPLITWDQLRREYPRFYMVTSPGPFVWLPDQIKAEGGHMTILSMVGSALVLEVDWNGRSGLEATVR